MNAAHPNIKRFRRFLLTVALAAITMVTVAIIALVLVYGLETVQSAWDSARFVVVPVKWTGLVIAAWFWPVMVDQAATRWHLTPAYRDWLLSIRWQVVALWLALLALSDHQLLYELIHRGASS